MKEEAGRGRERYGEVEGNKERLREVQGRSGRWKGVEGNIMIETGRGK